MSKSPIHSAPVRRLIKLLGKTLPPGFFLSSEQPVTCEDSEPDPGVAVIRGTEEEFWVEHPATAELVIEVCVTSHDYQRSKLRACTGAGVKECWFILGPEKQIEVFRQPENRRFTENMVLGPAGVVRSSAMTGLTLSLDALFTK